MNVNQLESKEVFPGLKGKFIHGDQLSWAFWEVDKGAEVPLHQHPHEQMMHVVKGTFSFTLNAETKTYTDGDVVVIPSNQLHAGKALTDCVLMDVFTPVRKEYQ